MRVLLVDDHQLFREGIELILANLVPDIDFVHAASCEAALQQDPEVINLILLDFHLPGASDRDAVRACRERFPGAVLVVVSGEENPATIRQVISDGASGYIPKASSPQILLAALNLVLAGGSYLPPHVLDEVGSGSTTPVNSVKEAIGQLSQRQQAVLARAIKGTLNKVIASELNIAEGTVKAHLSAAFKAIGARNRTEAVYLVTKHEVRFGESS